MAGLLSKILEKSNSILALCTFFVLQPLVNCKYCRSRSRDGCDYIAYGTDVFVHKIFLVFGKLWSSSPLCKDSCQILWKQKKGASRCIYQSGALDCLSTINANDPRPKRAVALGHTTKDRPGSRHNKLKHTAKTACLRERSPCSRLGKLSRFHFEGKSKKLFYTSKTNIKLTEADKKLASNQFF